ncbi:MAG: hypothetical protein HY364_01170 [Candidatus Aenigmarchaeota archaeon]|nr:hypothetical protein [Candidatus Aenigmarchaeota archaeon]
MGIEEMASGILNEAEKRAQAIIQKGREEERSVEEEIKNKAKLEKETIKNKTNEEIMRLETREIASARVTMKKQMVIEKKKIIDSIYDSFFSAMEKEIAKEELLETLFEAGKSKLGSVDRVYVNPNDVSAAKKLCKDVRTKNISGGIVLEKGKESVDLSMETLRGLLRQRTLKSVSNVLFGD